MKLKIKIALSDVPQEPPAMIQMDSSLPSWVHNPDEPNSIGGVGEGTPNGLGDVSIQRNKAVMDSIRKIGDRVINMLEQEVGSLTQKEIDWVYSSVVGASGRGLGSKFCKDSNGTVYTHSAIPLSRYEQALKILQDKRQGK